MGHAKKQSLQRSKMHGNAAVKLQDAGSLTSWGLLLMVTESSTALAASVLVVAKPASVIVREARYL